MPDIFQLPPPGADGTYSGSCIVCLRGTDTGVALKGEAEFAIAALRLLGVPNDEALIVLSSATGCDPGMVPEGEITLPIRLCSECTAKGDTGLPVGVVALGVPVVSQGGG